MHTISQEYLIIIKLPIGYSVFSFVFSFEFKFKQFIPFYFFLVCVTLGLFKRRENKTNESSACDQNYHHTYIMSKNQKALLTS